MPTRYIVHTKNPQTLETHKKIFESSSGDDARGMAEAIGLEVLAIEVDAPASSRGEKDDVFGAPPPAVDDPRDKPEREDWQGSPSQWTNFWWYVLCLLVIPIPWAVWKLAVTATTDYAVTTQRLTLREGVFNRTLEEIELYRIKDTTLTKSFWQRVLGLGSVVVESSDTSMPRLVIPWVKDAEHVRQTIRQNVEAVRRARGVRELDVN
ncbi:MAG: PH domain-containing protein [Planctomycetota bacterium]